MTPRRVVIVAYPGAQSLDVAGPYEVFAGANSALRAGGRPDLDAAYQVHLVSTGTGADVTTESGLRLGTEPTTSVRGLDVDTLVIAGGTGVRAAAADPATVAAVRELAEPARRVVTVCSGAFLAAAAGLLDGRRVTTHWARAARLAREHPTVDVDPDPIYIRDGRVWSSAGVTAGIDLALALVEDDHGADVAQTVARWLVMFLRRPGGQTQFSASVWSERAPAGPIREAQTAIDHDPGDDHCVAALARRVGMSERHFARCFTESTGTTPARYVAAVRVEAARRALESTPDTVEVIARRCGFGTGETMRRTFARDLGVSPDAYRARFHT